MIVAMQDLATEEQIQAVIDHLVTLGFELHRSTGARQMVLGAVGARPEVDIAIFEVPPGVQRSRISSPEQLGW